MLDARGGQLDDKVERKHVNEDNCMRVEERWMRVGRKQVDEEKCLDASGRKVD